MLWTLCKSSISSIHAIYIGAWCAFVSVCLSCDIVEFSWICSFHFLVMCSESRELGCLYHTIYNWVFVHNIYHAFDLANRTHTESMCDRRHDCIHNSFNLIHNINTNSSFSMILYTNWKIYFSIYLSMLRPHKI